MNNYKYCNQINDLLIGKLIILNGWIKKKIIFKNFINIIFRDYTGIIKLIFYKNLNKINNFNKIKNLKIESSVKVKGYVNKNNNIFTIHIKYIKIFEISKILPINLYDDKISEKLKLKYRYLYLRNSNILNILKIKSDVMFYINKFMNKNKFVYIETPILSKPTIEGAKSFLVNNTNYKNKFFSLSQSPQIFKQILMISGLNKYYQFAKCFRNEDSRKNRQIEFTQLDIECSFVNENYIIKISEKLIKSIFKKFNKIDLQNKKINKFTYKDSLLKFCTDKPDLRNPIKILNITNIFLENNIIINNLENNLFILIIPNYSKKELLINKYKKLYFKYMKIYILNIINLYKDLCEKFLYKDIHNMYSKIIFIYIKNNFDINNNIFILIDNFCNITNIVGKFSKDISYDLNLINEENLSIVWINDFPMFKKNKDNKLLSNHHPFTSPKYNYDINHFNIKNAENLISNSYDLIINGVEIASGSLRITNSKLQKKIFKVLNISENKIKKNFGFFLNSLNFGTPPHAGIAFGFERLIMLLTNSKDIKDVIAFPKSTSSYDYMINTPS